MNQLHSESINEIAIALCKASKKIVPAIKSVENTFFKKNYADLKEIDHVCRIPLAENDLVVSQIMDTDNGIPILITILMHKSGQWLKSFYPITYDKTTPQAIGSGVTYARRYSLAAICGVVTEDDDAEAATKREQTQPLQQEQPTAQQPKSTRKASEKETMIAKMNNAKSLVALQSLIADCPDEWKNAKFNTFTKGLESKFDNWIEEQIKEQFKAEEVKK